MEYGDLTYTTAEVQARLATVNYVVASAAVSVTSTNMKLTLNRDSVGGSAAVATFNAATTTAAGVMTATQCSKLSKLPSAEATTSAAGWMSAADKAKLDKVPDTVRDNLIYATEFNTTSTTLQLVLTTISEGEIYADFPAATESAAGIMTGTDKYRVNSLGAAGTFVSDVWSANPTYGQSTVQFGLRRINPDTRENSARYITINAATDTTAGVMSAADKAKLDAMDTGGTLYLSESLHVCTSHAGSVTSFGGQALADIQDFIMNGGTFIEMPNTDTGYADTGTGRIRCMIMARAEQGTGTSRLVSCTLFFLSDSSQYGEAYFVELAVGTNFYDIIRNKVALSVTQV